jgi:ech hydrogenase subunit A
MLIIFHAVTKSVLFLCVGTAEHNIGSRDIEDMDGLFSRMPSLATIMIIGISAMFLAPFGMLVSKWAALEGVILSGNPLLLLMIIFGSAATLFYWGKWLGKLVAVVAGKESIEKNVHKTEGVSLVTLAGLTIGACLTISTLSDRFIIPYLTNVVFPGVSQSIMTMYTMPHETMVIVSCLVAFMVILPIFFYGKTKKRITHIYLSGTGRGDDLTYQGAMEKEIQFGHRNWYMDGYFNERKMNVIGVSVCSAVLVIFFIIVLGVLVS